MTYILGIDLGTSSLKGILVDKSGNVICSKAKEYPLIIPQTGYSEQDPKEWVNAFDCVFTEILDTVSDAKDNIEGISFSGQMHTLVTLDENDNVIRNAILWNDVRTSNECKEIMDTFGDEVLKITKNIALEGFTLPKLLWLKNNEENTYKKIKHILLPKDYLAFYITGVKQMEYSDAAGTLVLDIEKKEWSEKIAKHFDLPIHIFPKLQHSYDEVGVMKDELLQKFNLKNPIHVFSGGADNACAAIGAGIFEEGTGMCSIGTSGVFLGYEKDCFNDYEGDLHYFNHVDDAYYTMGVTLSAGNSLRWFVDTFANNESYDEVLKNISKVNIGSDGLLFTPYIMGERTPHFDSEVRGSFIGIDNAHTRDTFARSVLEGITFSLKDSQNLMEKKKGMKFSKIISVGGGAKNIDWLQMQADIFNAEIVTLTSEQGPALGAAMIAAYGLKWFSTFEECVKEFVEYKEKISPIQQHVEEYKEVYELYTQAYETTKLLTHELTRRNKKATS